MKSDTSPSLGQSATSSTMQSLIASERPRSRSIDAGTGSLHPRKALFDPLVAVVKVEFVLFWVLLVAVALLHFKLNRGETGELNCRGEL